MIGKAEEKALRLFRKNGLTILPGELTETLDPVEVIEDRYSCFDKEIRTSKKRFQIYTYKALETRDGVMKKFMAILDLREKRFEFNM